MRDWLKDARKEAGLTCAEMGKILSISETMYFRIETGERQQKMTIDTALKISKALQIPLERIIAYELH